MAKMEPKKLFCQLMGAVYGIDRDPLTRLEAVTEES